MKKIYLLFVAVSFSIAVMGQPTTSAYLKKIPALPKDSCNISRAGAENFSNQVANLIDQVENDIRMLNKKARENAAVNEGAAKEAALQRLSQQYGMSAEDIDKMKNAKKMSAADKQAFANKMMMQQTNISMDEVKNMSKMSESGKKAYAQAYSAEVMAAGPPKQAPGSDNAKETYQLLGKQQDLMNKISANSQKIGEFYSAVDNDHSGEEMLKRIDNWHSKLTSMMGVDYGQGKKMDSLSALIKKEQISYCNKFTPRYRYALRQHLSIMKASMPDYSALGDITAEITKSQTGVDTPPETKETAGMEALNEYLGKLKDAYQFTLYYPDK